MLFRSPYSARNPALAGLYENLPEEVMKSRKKSLLLMAEESARKYREKFLGSGIEVVAEKEENGLFSGTSGNYLKTVFRGCGVAAHIGDIVFVAVEGFEGNQVRGRAEKILWTKRRGN